MSLESKLYAMKADEQRRIARDNKKSISKALDKKKARKMEGMARGSSSQNSGYDDNYMARPSGKGTHDSPFRFK